MELKKKDLYLFLITTLIISIIFLSLLNRAVDKPKVKVKDFSPIGKKDYHHDYNILALAGELCDKYDVPYPIVEHIGANESGWKYPTDSTYIRKCINTREGSIGDLQNLPNTYKHYANMLNLPDTPTRNALLEVSIIYLSDLHYKYNDWEKVRYAYARGRWKPPFTITYDTLPSGDVLKISHSNWTTLEHKFMRKFDWKKYN